MQTIVPHLWYDKEAAEAAAFYTSIFANSRIKNTVKLYNTPSGTAEVVSIELAGQPFMLLSAGPLFKFTPAISFLIDCRTKEEVDELWAKLSAGGTALMELGEYPFSERYGWTQDKYGLSWQVMHMGDRPSGQKIIPVLMFTGAVCGKAEEAITFYISVFKGAKNDAKIDRMLRYGAGDAPNKEGTVVFASFTLADREFGAMDSAGEHHFTFNEAVSLMTYCDTQKEIDYYWEKLSARPEAEQCGWLKDRYGVSWQIVPTAMDAMLTDPDARRVARVTEAFLTMKKFDIKRLEEAYANGQEAH